MKERKAYVITASYTDLNGQQLDCSGPEVLGDSYGKQYADRARAEELAEEYQDSLEDFGLAPSTVYRVEERVGAEVSEILS